MNILLSLFRFRALNRIIEIVFLHDIQISIKIKILKKFMCKVRINFPLIMFRVTIDTFAAGP